MTRACSSAGFVMWDTHSNSGLVKVSLGRMLIASNIVGVQNEGRGAKSQREAPVRSARRLCGPSLSLSCRANCIASAFFPSWLSEQRRCSTSGQISRCACSHALSALPAISDKPKMRALASQRHRHRHHRICTRLPAFPPGRHAELSRRPSRQRTALRHPQRLGGNGCCGSPHVCSGVQCAAARCGAMIIGMQPVSVWPAVQ